MEEEEAILKKQLDEAKDFESRREVRQKLRELRKKKINALDSDVGNSAQRSRRQETKTVEETVTDNNTSPSEKESEKSVNNCGNGEVNEEKGGIDITEELDTKEEENGKCESEPLAEVLNGDSGQNKGEEDQEEKSEIPAVDEPTLPTKPPRPADGKITEEYVEQLQDVEDLEELLKQVPLSEFNLRKKIRITIRERKKQKVLENTQKTRSNIGRSNISGHFPSKISQDIGRAKEANPTKTDGKKSFGKSNIDAMFEKRRRERVMAKKKEAAEKKQGRAAFKAKLEAQNPKPANSGGRSFQTGSKITRAMIEWCRRKTDGYEGVDIQNFTTSWTNGLAMCALLHRFVPEKIDYGSLNPKDRRGNWKLAFDVAGECGVEPLLELEDVMACSVPEPKSLMTYVHFIYQFFCEAPKEKRPPPGFDDDEEEDDDD